MAQPEQSKGEPSGRPHAGGSANKVDLAAGLPPTTRRSKRRMIVICSSHRPKGTRATHPSLRSGLRLLRAARSVTTRGKNGPFTRTCTWNWVFGLRAKARPQIAVEDDVDERC